MPGYIRHRFDFAGKSEFSGETRPNTLPANPTFGEGLNHELSAQHKMRLIKLTSYENPLAPPDGGRSWNGLKPYPYSDTDLEDYRGGGRGASY